MVGLMMRMLRLWMIMSAGVRGFRVWRRPLCRCGHAPGRLRAAGVQVVVADAPWRPRVADKVGLARSSWWETGYVAHSNEKLGPSRTVLMQLKPPSSGRIAVQLHLVDPS